MFDNVVFFNNFFIVAYVHIFHNEHNLKSLSL